MSASHDTTASEIRRTLESLPNELILSITMLLSIQDVARLGQTCHRFTELCRDQTLWSQRAFRDMGYPKEPFCWLFWTDWMPLYCYHYIQTQMIPSLKALTTLNEMALHWNVKTNHWEPHEIIYMHPNFHSHYHLDDIGLTFDEAREVIQSLTSKLSTQFLAFSYVCLRGTLIEQYLSRDHHDIYEFIEVPHSSTTLIHDPNVPGVNYLQILQATSALVPIKTSARIPKYSFDGFSPEGYPVLKVEFSN